MAKTQQSRDFTKRKGEMIREVAAAPPSERMNLVRAHLAECGKKDRAEYVTALRRKDAPALSGDTSEDMSLAVAIAAGAEFQRADKGDYTPVFTKSARDKMAKSLLQAVTCLRTHTTKIQNPDGVLDAYLPDLDVPDTLNGYYTGSPKAAYCGSAGFANPGKMLSFRILTDGVMATLMEHLGRGTSGIAETLTALGFEARLLQKVCEIAQKQANFRLPKNVTDTTPTLLLPAPDQKGGYLATTPIPSIGGLLAIRDVRRNRGENHFLPSQTVQIGGSNPQNVGEAFSDYKGATFIIDGTPWFPNRIRGIGRAATLAAKFGSLLHYGYREDGRSTRPPSLKSLAPETLPAQIRRDRIAATAQKWLLRGGSAFASMIKYVLTNTSREEAVLPSLVEGMRLRPPESGYLETVAQRRSLLGWEGMEDFVRHVRERVFSLHEEDSDDTEVMRQLRRTILDWALNPKVEDREARP